MKSYLIIIGIIVSIALIEATDTKQATVATSTKTTTNKCACNKPCSCNQPKPKFVCYNVNQLLPFCPPCIEPCAASCPCIFPDADQTIITPKQADDRPPFCPKCEVHVNCIVAPCFAGPQPCTAEVIQRLIDEK